MGVESVPINLDLSGVSGFVSYTYDNSAQYIPQIISALFGAVILLVLVLGLLSCFKTRKTKEYREELVDLYVAATVRKFATDDGLNLEDEYKNFVKTQKKRKLEEKGLSNTIEDELSEQVIAKQEEKLNNSKKK